MARYSGSVVGDLQYSKYGYGIYGSGDIPDLRLGSFSVKPLDINGQHIDPAGNAVYGRSTVSWKFRSKVAPGLKILRSTKGMASAHDDPFSAVIAVTAASGGIALTSVVREEDGWTTIATASPHYLRPGDTVTFSGTATPSGWAVPIITGNWLVSIVTDPVTFTVRQPYHAGQVGSVSSASTGTVSTADGIPDLPRGSEQYTDRVTPGVEYYYALFAEDPTVAGLWLLVGSQVFLAPSDHGTLERLITALPAFMTNADHGTGLPAYDVLPDTDQNMAPGSASILKLVAGLAWVWDGILTQADKMRRPWEPSTIPSAFVGAACQTLGLPTDRGFGERTSRELLRIAPLTNALRGTREGLTALVEALSGLSTTIGVGKNLMLTTECASFEQGTGHWFGVDASIGTTTALATPSPAGTFFALSATSAPAAMTLTRAASVESLSAGIGLGVLNRSVQGVLGQLSVVTAKTHGLSVGDEVVVRGAYSGVDIVGTVSKVVDSTSYILRLASGSTIPATGVPDRVGATVSPTGRNPFAVVQGVPVKENTDYRLSYFASILPGQSVGEGTSGYVLSWWDTGGVFLGSQAPANTALPGSLTQTVGTVLTSPARAAYATVKLTFSATSPYIDGGTAESTFA